MPALSNRKRKDPSSNLESAPQRQRQRMESNSSNERSSSIQSDISQSASSTITKVNGFTVHRLKGPDLPQFHDWVHFVIDNEGGQIVMYGGTAHKPSKATNQFRIFDVARMTWEAPAVTGYNRASPLPILIKPADAIFKSSTGQRYLLLFGGVESPSGKTSSKLVSVDLDSMKWCYESVKGGKVFPRVNASMVVIKNRLFIFGGRDKIAAKATLRRSYSIAEHDGNEWTWIAMDVPYDPVDIEAAYDGKVAAIYDGVKILLGPGRRRSAGKAETITFNPDRWFVFHTRHRTFSALFPLRGALPDEANWYWMQPVAATTERSRSDDALIVAWVPYGTGDLVPDIWRCNIDEETISCMNIRSQVWDLDLDVHCFVACKGRFFLLGHDNVIYKEDGTQATGEDGELATTLIEDALYNVVVEIEVDKFNMELKVEEDA